MGTEWAKEGEKQADSLWFTEPADWRQESLARLVTGVELEPQAKSDPKLPVALPLVSVAVISSPRRKD